MPPSRRSFETLVCRLERKTSYERLESDALWGGALALGVMKLMRMSHSPAAATAMIAVVPAIPRWEFVVLIGSAAAILVAVGLVGNKINRAKYPHYW